MDQARTPRDVVDGDGRPLGLGLLLGYGVGQAGAQLFRDAPSFLLPAYLTTALGVPAWMMGVVIFLPKLWVVLCDPLVGGFSDRLHTPIGRRRPLLLAGAIACPVALVLLLNAPIFPQVWARAAYVTVMFTLAMTAFSLFSVPYLALGAEVSDRSDQRTRLMSYRLIFVAVGIFVSIGLGQRLLSAFGGGSLAYSKTAVVFAAICLASMGLCFIGTRSAPIRRQAGGPTPGLVQQWRLVAANRAFMLLLGIHFLQLLGQAANATVWLLFFVRISGHPAIMLPISVLNGVAIILSQPIWLALAKRHHKASLFVLSVALTSLNMLSWAFVVRDSHVVLSLPFAGDFTAQDLGVCLRHVITGFCSSGLTLMSYALFTDTVEAYALSAGVRQEGAFAGVWSAVEKVAFAGGPLIVGVMLSLCGFVETTKGLQAPQSVLGDLGIRMGYSILPVVLIAATLPLVLRLRRMMIAAGA